MTLTSSITYLVRLVLAAFLIDASMSVHASRSLPRSLSRIDALKSMYAFEGFVYALDSCPSQSQMSTDFNQMKAVGARSFITFGVCNNGTDVSFYIDVLTAAKGSGIYAIPLIWTLSDNGQSFEAYAVPIMNAVVKAVAQVPDYVIAIALGDEPLYDNDAGSVDNLAKYIQQLKSDLSSAGLPDIPVSISDMPYGWQSAGDISSMVEAVDFFMINNFPYFSQDAESGGSDSTWTNFVDGINYMKNISNGKPLLVTQTGWPSNEDEFSPNSKSVVASVASEQAYWELLDSRCSYFKQNGIGWMWRAFNDGSFPGWGAYDTNGKAKWSISADVSC